MSTVYRIEGIISPNADYKKIIFLAYLFRVAPDAALQQINGVNVNSIYTPPKNLEHWNYTITTWGTRFVLNMRRIYNELSSYGNYWLGQINQGSGGPINVKYYYVMCQVNPVTGYASPAVAQKGLKNPITLTIDETMLGVNEPYIKNSTVYALPQLAYCDGGINLINRSYEEAIFLTV